jgi:hypothetical protein
MRNKRNEVGTVVELKMRQVAPIEFHAMIVTFKQYEFPSNSLLGR